jgi:4-amino-4-deoxy-L-arabinose transferase-like glycosyltransferase
LTEIKRNKYFLIILFAAIAIRMAFVFAIPAWLSPDEYPHYWIAKEIAEKGEYPMHSLEFPKYEAFQPPLYYIALSVPVYLQNNAIPFSEEIKGPSFNLILLRLISVFLGALSIIFAYLFFHNIRSLKEDEALYAAAFIALLPTFAGVNASLNNDSLVILLSIISLYYASKHNLKLLDIILAGLSGGLAFITKMSALPVFIIGLYLIIKCLPPLKKNYVFLPAYILPWLVFALLLFYRDLLLYGDIFVIAPEKERFFGFSFAYAIWAVRNLVYSFWLAFGRYYDVVPPPLAYLITFFPIMILALLGWIKRKVEDKNLLLEITIAVFISAAASLYYTLTYKEGTMTSWGKNLYPVLPYFALFFILGWKKFLNNYIVPNICLSILLLWNIWAVINISAVK